MLEAMRLIFGIFARAFDMVEMPDKGNDFFMKMVPVLLSLVSLLMSCADGDVIENKYLASNSKDAVLYSIDENECVLPADTLARGTVVQAAVNDRRKIKGVRYLRVLDENEDRDLFVPEEMLVDEWNQTVKEKHLFVRTPASVIDDEATSHISTLAPKGAKLEIMGFDTLCSDGVVRKYRVRLGKKEGVVYGKYLLPDSAEAVKRYRADVYDRIHGAIKNPFGGGDAIGCDFYPTEKVKFENNRMPEACYCLYLNISPAVLGNIEAYIALAKRTKINTMVIDVMDNECPGYKADAMKQYSPTNYMRAGNKEEMYRKVVRRLHEEGMYAVGRITCFKDTYFVKDHPEVAITERATGNPFFHNKAYWPSAYDRTVWQFKVELAKEAVRKFGFDEINFDYVRFPDRMTKVENLIDYHNRYNESKVQAIQRFVQYACDEIHALGAYVSIDVFGEVANPGYTTAYGQYWPALSNVADVICGMPYPDHFANHYYGIDKPWNHPYQILNAWGQRVMDRQSVTPSPAVVRTWVQAYHVMRFVDRNGIDYNAENVEKEIRGLYDAGLTGGYCTWLASSNITKYLEQEGAFAKDYLKEYKQKQNQKSAEKGQN